MNKDEFGRFHSAILGDTTRTEVDLTEADYERVAKAVRQWQIYLPRECVESMIRMGWHFTT